MAVTVQHRKGTLERVAVGREVTARWLAKYGPEVIRDLLGQIAALQRGEARIMAPGGKSRAVQCLEELDRMHAEAGPTPHRARGRRGRP